MNRAERRRIKKYAAKNVLSVPGNIGNYSIDQISKVAGTRIQSLMAWREAREVEMFEGFTKEFQQKLFKAEDYIAVANILISLLAIKMTWGFTKANQKFVGNINAATEYLNRNGVEKVYKELSEQMEIELEFDSIDINKEFGFGGKSK